MEHDYDLIELPAFMREMAMSVRQIYVALRQQGFDQKEALTLVAAVMTNGRSSES